MRRYWYFIKNLESNDINLKKNNDFYDNKNQDLALKSGPYLPSDQRHPSKNRLTPFAQTHHECA